MRRSRVFEFFLEALETEQRRAQIYKVASESAVHAELRREWQRHATLAGRHSEVMHELCEGFGLDPRTETRGRRMVRLIGNSLIEEAMLDARRWRDAGGAELVAAECAVLAETKSRQNWELVAEIGRASSAETRMALEDAHRETLSELEHPLHRTRGWLHALRCERLGLPALPVASPEIEEASEERS